MGTLFERGLDPDKRSQLGAHYTDRDKIMMIVRPVIVEPLLAEWAEVKARITDLLDKAPKATKDKLFRGKELAANTKAQNDAEKLHKGFIERLKAFRVLDPACGSGNFLYIALLELKNIEHRANLEAEALGLPRAFPTLGPEAGKGHRDQPLCRRTGPRVGLDWRDSMDAPQRVRGRQEPHPAQPWHHRVPGCAC